MRYSLKDLRVFEFVDLKICVGINLSCSHMFPFTIFPIQDWTIIRPGGLKDGPRTGRAILTQDIQASGFVHRADVADMIVQVLGCEDGRCTRKEFTVVDPMLKSGYEYKAFSL